MDFIEPKKELGKKADWYISDHTKAIVKYYSEYTGYDESEIVDVFLKNLLKDENFTDWIQSKRRNKRMVQQLRLEEEMANV